MNGATGDVAVVSLGETTVGKLPGWSPVQVQTAAALAAIRDAGLSIGEVDGLVNLDPYARPHSMFAVTIADQLGLRPRWVSTVDVGGSVTTMALVQTAAWAISAGHCETVVCVYGENMRTSRPDDVRGAAIHNRSGGEEWEEPWGAEGMVIPYAMLADRYLHEGRGTLEDLAAVAVTTRAHAARNPNAMLRTPLTVEEHLAGPVVASPFRVTDCSAIADGGGAVVVTTLERARSLPHRPVTIAGFAVEATHGSFASQPDLDDLALRRVASRVFDAAGHGAEGCDVAMIHDAFTLSVLLSLEAMGFCEVGGAGALVRSGATSFGGRCPVNTHGGLLSQGHVGGMLHLVECVRQLQGRAGDRQVDGARRGVVLGNGGVFSVCGAMVLEAA